MADIPDFTPIPGGDAPLSETPQFTPLPATVVRAPHRGTKPLDNASADDPYGLLKNVGTGLAKTPTIIPGFAGAGRDLAHFLSSNVIANLPGEKRTSPQVREDLNTNAKFESDRRASIHGPTSGGARLVGRAMQIANTAPTPDDIYKKYEAPYIGEYEPTGMPGRMLQAGLEGMVGPGGKAKLVTMAGKEAPGLLTRAGSAIRSGATSAPAVNATMSATAAGVGEATGSPGAGILASFAVPKIRGKLGAARATTADVAADKLHAHTQDPDAALNRLRALSKNNYRGEAGSRVDLPEATGDPLLAKVSKGQGVANDEFGARVNDLRNEQSQNRGAVLGSMSNGTSETASEIARKMRDDIHAKAEADTKLQQGIVDTLHPPEGADKASLGKKAVDIAETNNERARAAVTKLYRGIDPENKIHVDLSPMNLKASQILNAGTNPQKFLPSPEAEKVLAMARDMPPTMTFNDLVDFDKTVGQARWRANKAGDPHGADMLRQLQNHMDEIRDGSLDRRATWEKGAVERGELTPDKTVAANIERQHRDAATGYGSITASAGEGQPGTAGRVSPDTGTQTGSGTSNTGSSSSVSGNTLDPNELAAAAERQRLAKQGHGDRKGMFEEGPVGGVLTADKPLMGNVPASAFAAGPAGGEKARAWLNAGVDNPGMLDAVKEMAVNELHDLSARDGAVMPKNLQAWKTKFGSALSAIDERDPGFSSRFDGHALEQQKMLDTVAQSTKAKEDFSKSAAAKLLNFEHPNEVDAHVAGLMGSKEQGPQKLRALMTQFAGHPDAQEGIRNSAVQWLTKKAQSRELLADGKASAPGNYLEALENAQPHMEAVFGAAGFDAAKNVAKEMARTKRMIDARLTRGGSDSANNLISYLNEAPMKGSGASALSTAEGIATWEMVSEAGHGIIGLDPGKLAKAAAIFAGKFGLHKWSAMIARAKGRGMQESADMIRDSLMDPEYGHTLLQHGADRAAAATAPRSLTEQITSKLPGVAQKANAAVGEIDRQPHAAGGAVKLDHAAHAARLVRSVPQERKRAAAGTEPMLKLSDNVVTKALAIANQGLNNG